MRVSGDMTKRNEAQRNKERDHGRRMSLQEPYRPRSPLDPVRIRRFVEGREHRAHEVLGAHPQLAQGLDGTHFAVWAPHAQAVSVVGDHNHWDARHDPMHRIGDTGVWTCFVAGVGAGARYKYHIVGAHGRCEDKADPFAREAEVRPCSASVVATLDERFVWTDGEWVATRVERHADEAPISIYEVHLGSWRRRNGRWLSYRELADELVPWVAEMGFTHLELMPIMEHPLDASWGYQPLGMFAPTSRFGRPDDLRHLIDRAHAAGLGVLLDWVPGHFPSDGHGLARFDGTPLFEATGANGLPHPDWGTLSFDFASPAVRGFLISSALHWLEDYHADGLRVDAVASMLYLDYSRGEGEWEPNAHGGRENLDAVAFLRELNEVVHRECPGALMIAEESTAWPGVSHGLDRGGLGFDQKWNMGWMNDTLEAMSAEPAARRDVWDRLTFSLLYAHSERFVLPLSHDEVVHGKRSLLSKMPGSLEERFANLRGLLALQWLHPGRKLLFMGGELGQWGEWDHDAQLDWALHEVERHRGLRLLVGDLNALYRGTPALHALDLRPEGFEWLDCHDRERGVLSFLRWAPGWTRPVAVVANLSDRVHPRFPVPLPWGGRWQVRLNTDAAEYGGAGLPVVTGGIAEPACVQGRDWALELVLPRLAVLVLTATNQ